MSWNLQRINNGGVSTGPGAIGVNGHELFVCVYQNQQHFAYLDANGNVQDAWWNGSSNNWNLQQINNASGPAVPGESIASTAATAAAVGDLFISVYNNQQHFAYRDANGSIQDVWYDGNNWHLQQINGASGPAVPGESIAYNQAPAAAGTGVGNISVSVYNNQQHFAYLDVNGRIQDVWFDGNNWNLQQINGASGPAVPGEYIAYNQAPAAFGDLFVSVYQNQQHFAYRDFNGRIQDVWWNGSSNNWNLQQINGASGPAVPGESFAYNQAPASIGQLFVSVYQNQQHFVYYDANYHLQDVWYDGNNWHLQQINGASPTIPGEYIASTKAPAAHNELFVSVYNNQQHFAYRDANSYIQDVWYDGNNWHLQQINGASSTVPGEYIAVPKAPVAFQNLFVCTYNDQQHFAYLAQESVNNLAVWDAWWFVPPPPPPPPGPPDDDDDDDNDDDG